LLFLGLYDIWIRTSKSISHSTQCVFLTFGSSRRSLISSRMPWLLFGFVLFHVRIHELHIHEAEWPVDSILVLANLHQPVELTKVTIISEVESEGHCRITLGDVDLSSLLTVVSFTVCIFYFYLRIAMFLSLLLFFVINDIVILFFNRSTKLCRTYSIP